MTNEKVKMKYLLSTAFDAAVAAEKAKLNVLSFIDDELDAQPDKADEAASLVERYLTLTSAGGQINVLYEDLDRDKIMDIVFGKDEE